MSAVDWFWCIAVTLFLAMAPTALALSVDCRKLDGDPVWAKPLKFELSLAIHFATLTWLAGLLPQNIQTDGFLIATAVAAALATLFEMGYMVVQATRQRRSHFNLDTPIEALLYSFMAMGAVVMTMAAGIVGLLLLSSDTPAIGGGLKIGGGVGLIVGTVLTLITAFRMGGALSRYNGKEQPDDRRMPLTGWSLTVADRRIPHFFATHIMQAMPVFGWACDAVLPETFSVLAALLFGGGYSLFTLHLFHVINRGDAVNLRRLWVVANRGAHDGRGG